MGSAKHTRVFECRHCGKSFTGRKRKYCSDECMALVKRERDRERKRASIPIRHCQECDAVTPIQRRTYCSNACSRAAEHSRRNFRMERVRRSVQSGQYGPPTYRQWLKCQPASRTRYVGIDQKPAVSLLKRNAADAWRYHLKHKASNEWCSRYYEALGRPWGNPRLTEAERWRSRYRLDETFAIRQRIRNAERKQRKRARTGEQMRIAIKKQRRSKSIESRLGYTLQDLRSHLEKQFTKGMNWQRFRSGEIHIDHITPKHLFDFTNNAEYRACWCLSNLRPCWAEDNLMKGRARTHLL